MRLFKKAPFLLAALLLLGGHCLRAATLVWTNAAGGNWSVAANWSPNQIPGASDNAVITNLGTYLVTLDANKTVNSLTLGGAGGQQSLTTGGNALTISQPSFVNSNGVFQLSGGGFYGAPTTGTLTVNGQFNWTSGALGGANTWLTVGTNGVMTLAGVNGTDYFLGEYLTNAGTINLQSGNLNINWCGTNFGVLVNLPGGLINLQTNLSINNSCSGAGLINQGIVRKSGGTGPGYINAAYAGAGILDVQSGTMALSSGGTLSGILQAEPGTAIYQTNCTFNGAMTVIGVVYSAGGTLAANGSLTVATNGVLNLIGNSTLNVQAPLTNNGTVNWLGGNVTVVNNNAVNFFGAIWNQPGALWSLQCNQTLGNNFGTGYEFFHNAGLVAKTNSAGTTSISAFLDNTGGTVQALSGTIQINNGCNLAGIFQATTAGTAITFNGGNFIWNSAANYQGNVQFTGGTVAVTNSVASLPAMSGVTISGLSNVVGGVTLTTATIVGGRETLTCTAFLTNCNCSANETVAGTVSWAGGTLNPSGSLTVAAAGVLNLIGNSTLNVQGPLTNNGTVNWLGGNVMVVNNNAVNYFGGIWNQAGAQWKIQCNQTLANNFATGYEIFHNAGLVSKNNSVGTTTFSVYLDNTGGTVQALSGTIQISNGGNLAGTYQATIGGTAINFNGGNYFWTGPPDFQGSVQFTGGTVAVTTSVASLPSMSGVTISGLSNVVGTVALTSANIVGSRETLTCTAFLTNCNCSANETVAGTVSWSGGTLNPGVSLTVTGAGVLNLIGNSTFFVESPLTNSGTVNWLGGSVTVVNNNAVNYFGVIWNQPGALWTIQCNQTLGNNFGTGYEIFHNAGLVSKTNSVGTTTFSVFMDNSGGTVQTLSGTIQFNNGCNLAGTFLATVPGTTINFNSGTYNLSGNPNFQGSVQFTGGSVVITGSTAGLVGSSVVISGLSNVVGSAWLTNCTISGAEKIVGTINMSGGTVANTGSLTVGGTGVLNLVGGGTFNVQGPLTNNGTVNWLAGSVQVFNNNTASYTGGIWNQAGGLWSVQCNQALNNYFGSGNESFRNAGLLSKTNSAGTTTFTVYFDNTGGTVQALSGTLQFNNGCNLAGTFQATAPGAAISFNAGTFTWSGTPDFQGNVQITGGTVAVTGSTPALVATGVFISGLSNVVGSALLTNCAINTAEKVVGNFNMAGGTLNGSGSLTVAPGGVLNLVGGGTFNVEGPLTNSGTVNWLAAAVQVFNNNTASYTGSIWNQAGAQWNIQCSQALFNYFGSGYESFHNAGLLAKTSVTGTTSFGVYFDNSGGTVQAQAGTIQFNNGCNLAGAFQATVAATAIYFNAGTFTWSGTPNFQGNVQITAGTVAVTGNTPALTATGASISGLSNVVGSAWLTNCTISGAEKLAGTFFMSGGTISGGGSLTVSPLGVLNLVGNSTFNVQGPLTNNGTVDWQSGNVQVFNNNTPSYTGGIWNQPGAQWDIQCNQSLSVYFGSGFEAFQNAGLISQSGVNGTTTISVFLNNNGGTLNVQSGLVNFTGTPSYVEAGETLNFGISGTNNNYGRASLSGNINFDGTLAVNFLNGYTPLTGAVFNLFNYGSHGGNFSSLNLPVLPGGQNWQLDYTASSLVLRVVAAGTNDTLLISGSVTDTNGNPIIGASVYAFINTNTFTNLIVNGSFELPTNNAVNFTIYNPGSTNIPGWTPTGPGPMDISGPFLGLAEDGAQYFDPTGDTSGGGGLKQTFPTVVGATYKLTFFMGYYSNPGIVSLGVTVGSISNSFTAVSGGSGSLNWIPQAIYFTASSNFTTVTFSKLTAFDSNDSFVDNVQVTPQDYGRVLSAVTGTNGHYQISVANGTFQVGVSGLTALGYNDVPQQTAVVSNANQIINFVAPVLTGAQLFVINTAVNPPGAGLASGGGTLGAGAVATVSATPVTNTLPYLFSSWTENGVFQSATNNYSFTVIRSRNLVANFTLPIYTVTASNNPANAGVISGAGSYFYNVTNVLTVVPNFGFIFTNWTEGGSVVGTNPTLTTVVFTNHSFVANFIEANTSHQVTTLTSPAGLAPVAGAGSYTNGQTASFSAPQFVTNSPFFYAFQQYTVSNTVVSLTNTFNKTFSTLDASNLQYVAVYKVMTILPLVTNVTANLANPVPATTNFLLTLRFDRSMNTNIAPLVLLTNSLSALQPVVPTNGYWTTTLISNDTYHTPPVTLTAGMDGTVQLFVSGAKDLANGILALTNAATFTVDATPPSAPVLSLTASNSSSATVSWSGYSAPADLSGFRIYLQNTNFTSLTGVPVYTSLGSAARSYTVFNLSLNTNYFVAVQAVDNAGNALTAATAFQVYLPSTVPPPVSIQVSAAGGSSALVSWSGYNTSALLGFAGYQVYYRPTNFTSVNGLTPQLTVAAGQTSVQVSGLDRTQTNYFAVVGYNNTNGYNPNISTAPWTDPYAGNISATTTIGGAGPSVVNIYHSITVLNNAQLIVTPGTTVLFAPGTSLTVAQGALIANGTALAPIIFDSANDIPGLTPAPGDWGGVTLATGAGTSSLKFVEIFYGAGLTVNGCSPTLQAFTANENAPWGLGLTNGATLSTSDALLTANAVGAQQFDSAALTIQNSVIQNNTTNAWAAGTLAMNAISNYWGTSVQANITPLLAGNVTFNPFLTYEPLLTPAIGTSNGVTQVGGSSVLLQLACRTAVSMRLSEDFTFPGVFFSPYAGYTLFPLSAGGGTKHIFAQFRSITGATNPPIQLVVNYITAGPVIQSFSLLNGQTLNRPLTVTATATATLGMQDIELYADGVGLATNAGGSFSYYFDIRNLNNAIHQVQLVARDNSGNFATALSDVIVSVNPPPAPVITSPVVDYVTNNATITVRGTAEPGVNIQVTDNGQVLAALVADASGNFAVTNATLQEGLNTLLAVASDSTGTTPSVSRHITVATIPPVAVVMNQPVYTPGSGLKLAWQFAVSGKQATTFVLYWATSAFASTNQATAHSIALTGLTDTLQALANGTYYFGVVGFDAAGNSSPLSGLVSAVYDATPPALSIVYGGSSPVGPGALPITLSSSKALVATPTLTIQPSGAAPVLLSLTNVALNIWQTVFPVTSATPSGLAYVQSAAQDASGNVFNGSPSGVPLVIDTTAPTGIIVTAPTGPVQTVNPTNITVSLTLTKLQQAGTNPVLNFQAPIGTHVAIALAGAGTNWSGTLPLTPAMSSGFGKFSLIALDSVGNVGTNILSGGQLELYNTALPSAPPNPTGLSAVSLPGGAIKLTWNSVSNAQIYRLYREPGTNFTMPGTLAIDNLTNTTVTDYPTNDGFYAYAVSASRGGSESGFANALIAVSDGTPPPAPTNVLVVLAASGMQVSWQQLPGEIPHHYNIYRNGVQVSTTSGAGPVVDYPPKGTNIYVVAASDFFGNQSFSAPATNVLLVAPVLSLSVVVTQGQAAALFWVSTDVSATGFNVYRNGVLQNPSPLTGTNYIDNLPLSDAVTYAVTAVNNSAQASPPRLVNVYPVALGLSINPTNHPILISYFDQYQAGITNRSSSAGLQLAQLILNRSVNGTSPLITTQALPSLVGAGVSIQSSLIVPEASLVATQNVLLSAVQQTDSEGSSVIYQNSFSFTNAQLPGVEITVTANQLPLAGGLNTFQAQINNPSSLPIEIITSRSNGSKPGDLYISVLNSYGQEVGRTPFQGTPAGTIFLPDGRGFVVINPGASVSISVPNVLVPAALAGSTNTTFSAIITNIYSQIGSASEVVSGPLSGSMVSSGLAVPPYNGTAQSDQAVYSNDQPIIITGQAVSTSTGLPVPNVPLNIGFGTRGYTWFRAVTTDGSGNYKYTNNPAPGFAGTLSIWAANPLVVDQLNQVSVVIYRAYSSPSSGDVIMSKNGTVNFNIQLINPGNVPLTGFAVNCAAFQVSGTNMTPIGTLTGTSLTPAGFTIAPNQSQTVTLQLASAINAPSTAEADFTFTSAEGAVATLTTSVSLLPAVPVLNVVSPAAGYVEANVNRGDQVSSQVIIVNSGLTTLKGITVMPPTNISWMQVNLPVSTNGLIQLPDLAQGQSNTFTVVYTPPATTPLAEYQDYLIIKGTNLTLPYKINLYGIVTSDHTGAVQFQVQDFLGQYLSGASVRLQNNLIHASAGPFMTDANGLVTITNLEEGIWNWQASAPGCATASGTLTIVGNQTVFQSPVLVRSLVTINFSVVPVPFTDQYEIQVEQTFSTFVPVPVLVMSPPYTSFTATPGFQATLNVSAQNAGLIKISDISITGQQTSQATLTPLITYLPVLLPQQNVDIPFAVTYSGPNGLAQQELSDCLPGGNADLLGAFAAGLAALAQGSGQCPNAGIAIKVAGDVAIAFAAYQAITGAIAAPAEQLASAIGCLFGQLLASGGGSSGGGGGGEDAEAGQIVLPTGDGCFTPDTLVLMANGSAKPISQIKTDDLVRSGSHPENIATVRTLCILDSHILEEIDLTNEVGNSASQVVATPEHFFWADGLGWKSGAELHAGDWLFDSNDQRVRISAIKMKNVDSKVYTLKLSGANSFYANNILVHDLCGSPPGIQTARQEVAP